MGTPTPQCHHIFSIFILSPSYCFPQTRLVQYQSRRLQTLEFPKINFSLFEQTSHPQLMDAILYLTYEPFKLYLQWGGPQHTLTIRCDRNIPRECKSLRISSDCTATQDQVLHQYQQSYYYTPKNPNYSINSFISVSTEEIIHTQRKTSKLQCWLDTSRVIAHGRLLRPREEKCPQSDKSRWEKNGIKNPEEKPHCSKVMWLGSTLRPGKRNSSLP